MLGKGIFVDTGAWFALQVLDDAFHTKAREIFASVVKSAPRFLTSNHVVGETYTLLRTSKGYKEARRFLDIIRQSPKVFIYFAAQHTEKEAFDLLGRFQDHPFSFVDAVSFAIMKREHIDLAFAFDSHFTIAGFNRIGIDIPV